MVQQLRIALVGAGSMGGALLRGWLAEDLLARDGSAIFDAAPSTSLKELTRAEGLVLNPPISAADFDALVIAVKPQIAKDALAPFSELAAKTLAVSVMAGKSIAAIAAALSTKNPKAARIIRAMPNLPAAVRCGVCGLYAPPAIAKRDRDIAESLMRAVGEVVWVKDEAGIDLVTAISGSGPAYFFLLGEALSDTARAAGMSEADAALIARQTLIGVGAYAAEDARPLGALRQAVTSPGGTTEAALKVFDGDERRMRRLVSEAVEAARHRARDLTD